MKIAHYEQMMDYLTGPRERFRYGGRAGFDKGGVAKVVEYINSLPDGTEVSTKDIRDFIEKNNINANPTSIRNMIAGSAPGKERFKDTIKFVDQRGVIKFNEETFKKIDDLLENPKIKSFRDIGKGLGYKTPKPSGKRGVTVGGGTPLTRNSPIIKAYVESRGGDPFEVFKVGAYKRGQPKVEKVLELQAKGMSTNAIAEKLFGGNRTNVRRIFKLFRPDAIKEPTLKSTTNPYANIQTKGSAVRAKREAAAFKAVGKKTASQTKKVIDTIKDKNAAILKMSDAEILNDPKIRYAMSIDTTGLKMDEPIKFNKYEDLSDKEFVKKVREKAKAKTFYTPEHISEVAKGKLNTAFPNNIVNAPGRMGSQVQAIKDYLRKNPGGEFAKQADEVLLKTGMQFKTGGTTFGVKENIEFNSKTNKSNIVENYFKTPSAGPTLKSKVPVVTDLFEMAKSIPDDIKRAKYLKAGFKTLGIAAAPLVIYDTYNAYKQGKPILETLEQGLIGTDIIGGTKRFMSLTPEERDARAIVKQDALRDLNIDMPVGLGFIEGPDPTLDLTLEEARAKAAAGDERVKQLEAQRNFDRATDRSNFFGGIKDKVLPPQGIELAGGGIAKEAGKPSGPPPESGPTPQGLDFLLNRGRKR
jgi:hypothetical protein